MKVKEQRDNKVKGWRSWEYVKVLRTKAANALNNIGIDPDDCAAVRAAIVGGRLIPNKTRNYGPKVHEYLCRQFGVKNTKIRKPVVYVCPCCGHIGGQYDFRTSNPKVLVEPPLGGDNQQPVVGIPNREKL